LRSASQSLPEKQAFKSKIAPYATNACSYIAIYTKKSTVLYSVSQYSSGGAKPSGGHNDEKGVVSNSKSRCAAFCMKGSMIQNQAPDSAKEEDAYAS